MKPRKPITPDRLEAPMNGADWTDDTRIVFIGGIVKRHPEEWAQRLPNAARWLEENGITPAAAVKRYELWDHEITTRLRDAVPIGPVYIGGSAKLQECRLWPDDPDGRLKLAQLKATREQTAAQTAMLSTFLKQSDEPQWSPVLPKQEWERVLGISRTTLYHRLKNGKFRVKPGSTSKLVSLDLRDLTADQRRRLET